MTTEDREYQIDAALQAIRQECLRAIKKHKPMNSMHEGYAVVLEELDEAWDKIKGDNHFDAITEMIQTGAICVRFIADLAPKEFNVHPPFDKT